MIMKAMFAWLTILLLLVAPSLQINIAFSNPLYKHYYVQQTCTEIPLHVCCVPMDILWPETSRGWFRAERIAFTKIPPKPMFASAWKYEKDTRQTACNGVVGGAWRTEGEEKWSYGYVPSREWPGLSGGWIVEWAPDQNGNGTFETAPRGVAFPNIIRILGDDYSDGKQGNGLYYDRTGEILRAIPLWRKSSCPVEVFRVISDSGCSGDRLFMDKIEFDTDKFDSVGSRTAVI